MARPSVEAGISMAVGASTAQRGTATDVDRAWSDLDEREQEEPRRLSPVGGMLIDVRAFTRCER